MAMYHSRGSSRGAVRQLILQQIKEARQRGDQSAVRHGQRALSCLAFSNRNDRRCTG